MAELTQDIQTQEPVESGLRTYRTAVAAVGVIVVSVLWDEWMPYYSRGSNISRSHFPLAVFYPFLTLCVLNLLANRRGSSWALTRAELLVVMALAQPAIDPESLSRFLLSAETAGAEVIPVLSKADLVSAEQQQQWLDRLVGWGYQALAISRHDPAGLAALADRLSSGVAVLCGPSGVGKSSLLNALVPDLKLRTAAVSGKLQRGRHTTRHVELHDLPAGGLLADTPGFNRPELPSDPELVAQLFPEIRQQLDAGVRCRLRNCRHLQEPGCGLQRQWERYPSYVELMG